MSILDRLRGAPGTPREGTVPLFSQRSIVEEKGPSGGHTGRSGGHSPDLPIRTLALNWDHVREMIQDDAAVTLIYASGEVKRIETPNPERHFEVLREAWQAWRMGNVGVVSFLPKAKDELPT